MKKLLLEIAGFVLLVIAGSLWWVNNSLDAQIASAIRRYGPEISGIPVSLSGVSISLVDDRASLHGLVVGNPDGYVKYGTAVASLGVKAAGKTIQKGVEAATQTIKGLLK